MTEVVKPANVCGACGKGLATEKLYLEHVCEISGHKPTEIEHLELTTTPNARAISDEALKRGAEKKE